MTAMDVESTKQQRLYEQEAKLPRKTQKLVEWMKLRHFERHWVGRYDAVATMSDVDKGQLERWVDGVPLFVIPNGVDVGRFSSSESHPRQKRRSVFIGNMGYAPNVQGILYFCDQILPTVRSQVPDFVLDVVGPNAPPEVERLGDIPGICLTGYADVRPYLWRSNLSIVPLLAGSGTRLKILESMAADCPVVSTSVGAEGLGLEHGRDFLLADEPQEFAHWIIELVHNRTLWQTVSQNGRERVRSQFDWHLIAPKLLYMLRTAIDGYHHRQSK
jgi:glycosyltransferase involved in cell wall biosynthesis